MQEQPLNFSYSRRFHGFRRTQTGAVRIPEILRICELLMTFVCFLGNALDNLPKTFYTYIISNVYLELQE